ncbi:pogo transposable element with KRAB domain [Rhizophagus irregularis DAOM 181602=DAOM 197198]|nr:pogo transposable element with KRAB domain [Rhizophagus irregularis DAOM 181602=DAOM 197198]
MMRKKVEENKKKKRSGTPGRKAFYPEAEKILYSWIIEQRKKGFAVNYISIRLQMCKILKESSIQALYPAGDIFNMNETSVWFDIAGNITVNNKGDKTVHIRTTGNDKNHFTVVLTCSADGTKYPPICIFKDKGWMTSDLMKNYIDFLFKIWMSENLSKEPAMMLYDSFRSHLKESVKEAKFKQHNFQLAVIPGGLTSVYQIIFNSFKKCSISNLLDRSEDNMVYEEIDRLIAEYEKENLEELGDDVEIVCN